VRAERDTVRERRDQLVRIGVAALHGGEELLAHRLHVRRVEARRHDPVGERRPARVERVAQRAQAEQRPVRGGLHLHRRAGARHRAAHRLLCVPARAVLRHREQEGLDPRGGGGHLLRAAEEVDVRGDDVVRGDAAQDDPHAADLEVARRRVERRRCPGARAERVDRTRAEDSPRTR
jgi:hypothetical protein